jgi:hypothetical protein
VANKGSLYERFSPNRTTDADDLLIAALEAKFKKFKEMLS